MEALPLINDLLNVSEVFLKGPLYQTKNREIMFISPHKQSEGGIKNDYLFFSTENI